MFAGEVQVQDPSRRSSEIDRMDRTRGTDRTGGGTGQMGWTGQTGQEHCHDGQGFQDGQDRWNSRIGLGGPLLSRLVYSRL